MKLMYAVWGDDLGEALNASDLREALRTAGARRLQVNVDDAEVAEAQLRLSTFETPVRAVVSVWTETSPERISGVLSDHADRADRVVGWEVEETERLVPPPTADGERADALAQIGLLRIPAELDEAEWLHRWQGQHTQVAIEPQATFGYIQNRVLRPVLGHEVVHAVVEELFPMAAMTDLHAFYGSGGDDAELQRRLGRMIESVTRFGAHLDIDTIPTSRFVYSLADIPG